jgi:hypothetical protein
MKQRYEKAVKSLYQLFLNLFQMGQTNFSLPMSCKLVGDRFPVFHWL